MPTNKKRTLRVHSHGGERLDAMVTLLSDLDYAYNGRVVFQSAMQRMLDDPDGPWAWPYRGWRRGGYSGLVLSREDLHSMVHASQRLRLTAARLESPGFFDFLGKSLSVEAISSALKMGLLDDCYQQQQNFYGISSATARGGFFAPTATFFGGNVPT